MAPAGSVLSAQPAYEKLVGRAYGEVDPKDPRNAVINTARFENNDPTKADDARNGVPDAPGLLDPARRLGRHDGSGGEQFRDQGSGRVNADGSPIVGRSIDDDRTVKGEPTYPTATMDKSKATQTVHARYEDAPTAIPADQWE